MLTTLARSQLMRQNKKPLKSLSKPPKHNGYDFTLACANVKIQIFWCVWVFLFCFDLIFFLFLKAASGFVSATERSPSRLKSNRNEFQSDKWMHFVNVSRSQLPIVTRSPTDASSNSFLHLLQYLCFISGPGNKQTFISAVTREARKQTNITPPPTPTPTFFFHQRKNTSLDRWKNPRWSWGAKKDGCR